MQVALGLTIPFLGTCLGSACVYLLKGNLPSNFQKGLLGFSSGVMVAASIFSLLLPAIDTSLLAAFIGFWIGTLFLLVLDQVIPHLHMNSDQPEGIRSHLQKTTMMVLAVTLHNIPEGMAVGVVFAGYLQGKSDITLAASLALAIGIAIQNFPEGAIISIPLHTNGQSKTKAFISGTLSGIVEPIGALLTICFASITTSILPYLLSFASGAMFYVVVEEMIPEMSSGKHSNIGVTCFAIGFTLMMVFDVAFS